MSQVASCRGERYPLISTNTRTFCVRQRPPLEVALDCAIDVRQAGLRPVEKKLFAGQQTLAAGIGVADIENAVDGDPVPRDLALRSGIGRIADASIVKFALDVDISARLVEVFGC